DARPFFQFSQRRAAIEGRSGLSLAEYVVASYAIYESISRRVLTDDVAVKRVAVRLEECGIR
ncbi:MAG TPA: hypothetical protein VGK90_04710, partial [Rhizomicrobium sp.]